MRSPTDPVEAPVVPICPNEAAENQWSYVQVAQAGSVPSENVADVGRRDVIAVLGEIGDADVVAPGPEPVTERVDPTEETAPDEAEAEH